MKKWEEDRPEAWNTKDNKEFKKGATLEGVYTSNKEITTANGTSMLYTIDKGGEMVAVWGTKKLDLFFKNMPVGIKIGLTYLGKNKLQSGKTFHDFELEYDETHRKSQEAVVDKEIDEIFSK